MYDNILNGILKTRNIVGVDLEKKYIESLKPFMTELWFDYQSNTVSPKYEIKKVQECYLLRYFPAYTRLLANELKSTQINLAKEELFSVSCFGCGPMSELVSLLSFFNDNKSHSPEMVIAYLFDIDSDSWGYARDIVTNYVIPSIWDSVLIETLPQVSDFTSASFWTDSSDMQKIVSSSNLVVFQNCLNEVPYLKHTETRDNICKIIEHLSAGAIIIFIDQAKDKYGGVKSLLNKLSEVAKVSNSVKILSSYKNDIFDCSSVKLPDLVANRLLFHSGEVAYKQKLVLRKKIEFASLVIQRL